MTDAAGEVYQQLEYFPQGETWINEVGNDDRIPYRFTGKELDEETQLYYFGARYYDPRVSLWTSTDPALGEYLPNTDKVGNGKRELEMHAPSLSSDWRVMFGDLAGMGGAFEPKNMALYTYSHNNPVIIVDPDGEEAYLISRPLDGGPGRVADHAFVAVVQNGQIIRRFSYGPSTGPTAYRGNRLVSLTNSGRSVDTGDDAALMQFVANPVAAKANNINATQINASDAAVIAAGERVDSVLGTQNSPGDVGYFAVPGLTITRANSNSAAAAVADEAASASDPKARRTRLPAAWRRMLPGANEENRIP